MADACEESSSDCSDSISGDKIPAFIRKVVAQKKVYNAKNPHLFLIRGKAKIMP